jgi:hypothetical protein
MRAILLPNGNLLIPTGSRDPDEDPVTEIGPDDPDYGKWLAVAERGEDPRMRKAEEED